jgi:hypothetical protein
MGQIIPTKIVRFDGGMQNDIRSDKSNGLRLVKNADILTYPSKIKPYNSSESGNDTPAREFAAFLYANSRLYGLGVQTGTSRVSIFYKDSYTDGTWNGVANGDSGAFARKTGLFVYYKGDIYGAQTDRIWKFNAGVAFADADLSIAHTTVSNGIVHSKDDRLYIGVDNKIIRKNDATTWDATASGVVLTLPTDYYLTSICEYGNYLAIACAPLTTAGRQNSRVFLWDRDSSLTTLSESIDWGAGTLLVLEEMAGELIGIMQLGSRLIVKRYAGIQGAQVIMEFVADSTIELKQIKQILNNRLYFMLKAVIDGTTHYGVWTIGKNSEGVYALSIDRTPNNDTDPNSQTGFYIATVSGVDYMFIAYSTTVTNDSLSKTNDSATTFSHNTTIESLIYDGGDASRTKKLIGVTVMYEPLPTAGSVTVKYKKDEDSSWTTIFTDTTDNSISHSAINIESSGATLPEYKECHLQILATGGAAVTGFSFESEVVSKRIY